MSSLRRGNRLVLAVLGAFALLASGCWTSYGGGWTNSRSAAEQRLNQGNVGQLEELWRVDDVDGSTSTPAVYGNVVYFGGWDGTLRAVDAGTGAEVWTTPLTTAGIDDSPLVTDSRVYIGDGSGNLHAVNRATGAVVWTRELDPHANARMYSSPVLVEGMIIVGVASTELALVKPNYTFRGSVVALDAATGAEQVAHLHLARQRPGRRGRVGVVDGGDRSGARPRLHRDRTDL